MKMTAPETENLGADGEASSDSSRKLPLARFRSRPMPGAAKAESTLLEEGPSEMPRPPFPPIKRAGRKKSTTGLGRISLQPAGGSRQDLAGRLIRFARPLALKYQLNLAHTFTGDEAREWVRASESTLMRLQLRNSHAEASGFYAELALALADERQKERGILAEPALKWVDGTSSLLVDLRGEK